MVKRNPDIAQLQSHYLFVEIAKRRAACQEKNPGADLISLGIGDTTEPVPGAVVAAMQEEAARLGTRDGYSGYQSGFGDPELRGAIARELYQERVGAEEVFISDGSKPDIGRLQLLFGRDTVVGVQDPSYPAYIASTSIAGKKEIVYLPCTPENEFFPDLDSAPRADVIFFCSPNNPTGTVPTRNQLEKLVQYAHDKGCIIVYDAAYAEFMQDPKLPKSIFEIDGARKVAMETGSFSKTIGFTGVRLGWTVVPDELCFSDGSPVINDWRQVMSTYFNGACNIAQAGALAALGAEGREASAKLVLFYLENARLLKEALEELGVECYGGDHTPYIWARVPGKDSWTAFQELLEEASVVTTPGAGFGEAGEGFLRFSGFSPREGILEAVRRLRRVPLLN